MPFFIFAIPFAVFVEAVLLQLAVIVPCFIFASVIRGRIPLRLKLTIIPVLFSFAWGRFSVPSALRMRTATSEGTLYWFVAVAAGLVMGLIRSDKVIGLVAAASELLAI